MSKRVLTVFVCILIGCFATWWWLALTMETRSVLNAGAAIESMPAMYSSARVQVGEYRGQKRYLVWDTQAGRWLASGLPAYEFDEQGYMLAYLVDTGEVSNEQRWWEQPTAAETTLSNAVQEARSRRE